MITLAYVVSLLLSLFSLPIILGFTQHENLCIVSHCYRGEDEIIRIISARKATKTETGYYSSNRGEV